MLLQTNSYIVPKDKRAEHARLMKRFRQTMNRLGCDSFEVFEQTGANWAAGKGGGRFIQMIRFRDRQHHLKVQEVERVDPVAQQLVREFCDMVNIPYQQEKSLFAQGYYMSVFDSPDGFAPPADHSEVPPPESLPAPEK